MQLRSLLITGHAIWAAWVLALGLGAAWWQQATLGQTQAAHPHSLQWLAGVGLLALCWALGSMWWLWRRVLAPLAQATQQLHDLAEGRPVPDTPPTTLPTPCADVAQLQHAAQAMGQLSLQRQALTEACQQLKTQLQEQASTDALTGLPNRRGFFALAEAHWANLQRHPVPTALALFDLDHFKHINDQHGHEAGDVVLVAVAAACQRICRRSDVLARYGGEEFVLLMTHCDLDSAIEKAQLLCQAIAAEALLLQGGDRLRISASVGVAALTPGETLQGALARADAALEQAKQQGRNRVVLNPAAQAA